MEQDYSKTEKNLEKLWKTEYEKKYNLKCKRKYFCIKKFLRIKKRWEKIGKKEKNIMGNKEIKKIEKKTKKPKKKTKKKNKKKEKKKRKNKNK